MSASLLPHNVSTADRAARVVVGLFVLSLAFVGPRSPFGYLGLIPLVTALVGSCPLYTAFGISTCRTKAR